MLIFIADGFSLAPRAPSNLAKWRTRPRATRLPAQKATKEVQSSVSESLISGKQYTEVTARFVAGHALLGERKGQPALQRLESDPSFKSIKDQRDRSSARLLVTTVERRLGQIDKVLDQCETTKKSKKQKKSRIRRDDLYVQACLRIGAAQLLFLDVAPHAALKETIDILRQDDNIRVPESKIKYANAVLRRITREGEALLSNTSPTDNIAPWLIQEWKQSWGDDATIAISESFMQQSPIHVSVNYEPGTCTDKQRVEQQEIVRAAFGDDTERLPHGSIRVGGNVTGAVTEWPLYREGHWWVQDAAAALPALALHNALSSNANNRVDSMHVVDLCAAPGGKTAQLISLGFGKVTAVELSPRRSRRLVENLERLGMEDRCNVCVADGSEWAPDDDEKPVMGVLVDVPCSATGTASKRPDVLRRNQEHLVDLLQVQEKLAQHCSDDILAPDGIMVYATCSILKQESEDQVEKLLERGRSGAGALMQTLPFKPGEIPGFDDAIDDNGWLRVLPGMLSGSLSECDGFFVARLRRIR